MKLCMVIDVLISNFSSKWGWTVWCVDMLFDKCDSNEVGLNAIDTDDSEVCVYVRVCMHVIDG